MIKKIEVQLISYIYGSDISIENKIHDHNNLNLDSLIIVSPSSVIENLIQFSGNNIIYKRISSIIRYRL